jgi:nucleoside-diphosphate-sugar epimerase
MYKIPLSVPSLNGNELQYLKECIETEWVSSAGKYVDLFEQKIAEYTGSKYAIACMNGTAAIQVSLRLAGESIPVFNNGDMKRDFTYIDDIITGTCAAIDKNYQCEVFNLGNHKSEQLMSMIAMLEKELNQKAIIDFQPIQPGDVKESFADILHSKKMLDFEPKTNLDIGITKFISWYNNYYKISSETAKM